MMTTDQRPVSCGIRLDSRNPGHVHLSVFVGRNPGARGRAGELTLRTDEWDELRHRAKLGNPAVGDIVEVWPPNDKYAHELAVGDVLRDGGGTVTTAARVERGWAIVEVDHTVELQWPAYARVDLVEHDTGIGPLPGVKGLLS